MYSLQQSISDSEPSETVPCGLHKIEPFLFLNCSLCGYRFTQTSTVYYCIWNKCCRKTPDCRHKKKRVTRSKEPEENKDKDVEYNGRNCRMRRFNFYISLFTDFKCINRSLILNRLIDRRKKSPNRQEKKRNRYKGKK